MTATTSQGLTHLHSPPIIRDDGRMVMRCDPRRRAYLYQSTNDPDRVTCPRCRRKAERTARRQELVNALERRDVQERR